MSPKVRGGCHWGHGQGCHHILGPFAGEQLEVIVGVGPRPGQGQGWQGLAGAWEIHSREARVGEMFPPVPPRVVLPDARGPLEVLVGIVLGELDSRY